MDKNSDKYFQKADVVKEFAKLTREADNVKRLNQEDARKYMNLMFKAIGNLIQDESRNGVHLQSLFTAKVVEFARKEVYNPYTGEMDKLEPHDILKVELSPYIRKLNF